MAIFGRLTAALLALFTILASIAEIVLATQVLHRLSNLHDKSNYVFDGGEGSAKDPTFYYEYSSKTFTFLEPWVFPQASRLAWAIPRSEIAAGVIALALGLIICLHVAPRTLNSGSHFISSTTTNRIVTILALIFGLATTGLFVYVFAASDHSIKHSMLSIDGYLGMVGYDTIPTWEVWTCTMSSYLKQHPEVLPDRSEWDEICRLTTGARWTLLPVFVLTFLATLAFIIYQSRPAPEGHTAKEFENVEEGSQMDDVPRKLIVGGKEEK